MRVLSPRFLLVPLLGFVLLGCGEEAPPPTQAEHTYGTPGTVSDALPAPAVAAEPTRYVGRRVTVDGRIEARGTDGCTLLLNTADGPPLRIEAPRTNGACSWQVPANLSGIAVAAGTLRVENDTLRLSANGVQVTPLRQSGTDSAP